MVKRAGPGISGSGLGMEAAGITARSAALCCNGAVEVEKTGPTSGPHWSAAQGGTRLLGRLAVGAGLQRLGGGKREVRLGVGSLARGPRSGLRGVLAWGDWSAGPGCREAEGESAARWRAGGIGTGRRASRGAPAGGAGASAAWEQAERAAARAGGCGAGRVGAGSWPWAELGRSAALGKGGTGRMRERRRPGPRWAGPGVWALVWAARKGLDWVLVCWALGLGFLSFSIPYSSPFLNLFQTKFEFKYEFEFKPHSNKSMHQHECNTNF